MPRVIHPANWGEATEQIQEVYYEGEIFKVKQS